MTTLYLCGAGNPEGVRLALDVLEATGRWDRVRVLDDDSKKHGSELLEVPVIGSFECLADHRPGDEAVNLVARTTAGRERARGRIQQFGIPLTSLIHPSIDLRGVTMGDAVTVYAGAFLSALSTVGDHAVVFTRAVLGHGASLGEGSVLAPGAVINARVRVRPGAYVGANASVLPDLEVGPDATVAACSSAVGDVPAGTTVIGVPAQLLGASAASDPSPRKAPASKRLVTELQSRIAAVLGRSRVSPTESFFDAGGSSRLAVQLQLELRSAFGVELSVVDVFRCPTAERLAERVSELRGDVPAPEFSGTSRAALRRRRRTALT